MQIYWNKRRRLHKKRVKSHRICLGHQHGRRFIVLGHQYGRREVMWKHSILLSYNDDDEDDDDEDDDDDHDHDHDDINNC